MKTFRIVRKIWELVSRLALIITAIDDMVAEIKSFYDWLFDDEPDETENEKQQQKK